MMLFSIIQIGPEVLNNTTNASSSPIVDFGILEATVTFLVGLLIFLTLRWQLDPEKVFWNSEKHELETRLDRDVRLNVRFLVGMFVSSSVSVGLAIFSATVLFARIAFVVSLIVVVLFIIHIIRNPPERRRPESGDDSTLES